MSLIAELKRRNVFRVGVAYTAERGICAQQYFFEVDMSILL
jgi:hypothetical protein